MRRGSWRAGDVDAGRHDDGDVGRGDTSHEGRLGEDRTMNRTAVCRHIEEVGLVPVLRLPSAELVIRAVEVLLVAGISVFEVTMTVPGAIDVIRELVDRFGGRA